MKRCFLLCLSVLMSACASNNEPAPDAVNWPGGCFEISIGKTPDGETPMACTLTNGQDSDQREDSKTDDTKEAPKTD